MSTILACVQILEEGEASGFKASLTVAFSRSSDEVSILYGYAGERTAVHRRGMYRWRVRPSTDGAVMQTIGVKRVLRSSGLDVSWPGDVDSTKQEM